MSIYNHNIYRGAKITFLTLCTTAILRNFHKHIIKSQLHNYIVLAQVAVVANNQSMNSLPKVQGLLSYRTDDRKLYLNEKSHWKALATQKDVSCITIFKI